MAALRAIWPIVAVAAILLVDWRVARADIRYFSSVDATLVVALLATQAGLASVWVSIGTYPALARLSLAACLAAGIWRFLSTWNRLAQPEFAPGFLTAALSVVVGLSLAQLAGYRLVRVDRAGTMPGSFVAGRFSIRDIMAVTALVGAAIAGLTKLGTLTMPVDITLVSCAVGVFLGAITLMCVLATLVVRPVVVMAFAVAVIATALGLGIGYALKRPDYQVFGLMLGTSTVGQLIPLILARWAGFRYRRSDVA